jgi:hypothetical protein
MTWDGAFGNGFHDFASQAIANLVTWFEHRIWKKNLRFAAPQYRLFLSAMFFPLTCPFLGVSSLLTEPPSGGSFFAFVGEAEDTHHISAAARPRAVPLPIKDDEA